MNVNELKILAIQSEQRMRTYNKTKTNKAPSEHTSAYMYTSECQTFQYAGVCWANLL